MENLKIENATLRYKNFSGTRDAYHPGQRNFSVLLDEESAAMLKADGWNVKVKPSKSDPDEMVYTLPVSLRFDVYPPKIVMLAGNRRTYLDENTAGELDRAEIKNIDLMIRPREWEVHGKKGIKAMLKTAYVTIEMDDLDMKYANFGEDTEGEADPF